jgi:N-acyl-D-amino-acid deacylase
MQCGRMTSATAQRFNLADRGVIREGLVADLTLFDAAIEDHATFDDPVQFATGIGHVFVNGDAVLADGKPTGRLPGRIIP